ncbi:MULTISPECIES: hypothetical protein [unclassified Pseudomonas]|uniref:hypothetical protein n=1 Tax=unclassified Pseudomonas TaxID=196821 RepID=UPI00111338BF|nr:MULTISPECIES: hypothetical protein [unclassified Pseudomonas]
MTADDFKNYKSGDKLLICVNGSNVSGYFKSIEKGRIKYEDMNFREHSNDLSELSEVRLPELDYPIARPDF